MIGPLLIISPIYLCAICDKQVLVGAIDLELFLSMDELGHDMVKSDDFQVVFTILSCYARHPFIKFVEEV